jgi:tRNA (guanine-N7-)-methyltransferase
MPHIKVQTISEDLLDRFVDASSYVNFRADSLNGKDVLFGVTSEGEEFLLQLKRESDSVDMLKYDKITRPLKVKLIKDVIAGIADEMDLKVEQSNLAHSSGKPPLASKYLKKIKDFESVVFPFESVAIEVGFGSGRHLLYQAKMHPQRLHIGIEIHTPSAQQVLRQIDLQGLENIWVVNYDARLLLEMLPSNSCEQIFVHFPVPWDKKPHRRVIGDSFRDEALRVLAPNGRLELRTDSEKYFWYTLETFLDTPSSSVHIEKNRDLAVTSKYEARWKRQEKNIYEVHLTSHEYSGTNEKSSKIHFPFGNCRYKEGLEERLPSQALMGSSYFVHIERIYRVADEGLLLRCAFGSFDRPEHKYILIDRAGCRYYASDPVKTYVNFQAHQKIAEYLNV